MYVVCVEFEIAEGRVADFLPLMRHQAQNSLNLEGGCHQFDVCSDPGKPNRIFLYELYSDRAAFDLHLASDHFRLFDAEISDMVVGKAVTTWSTHYDGKR